MLVVRRPFRNLGKVLTAGTVISDPAVIKHFKSRFAEGKIVEVNEHNFDSYYTFFKAKYRVELKLPSKEVVIEGIDEEAQKPIQDAKVSVTAKPVTKAVAAIVK
jgi:hypothetical protein